MKFEQLTRFARGFVYAYNGIRAAVQEERNFRFHLCAAFYAVVAAFWAELDPVEAALIALCVAAVLALSMWKAGTLEQITNLGSELKTVLPPAQSQPAEQDPGPLGKPMETRADRDYQSKLSASLQKLLNGLGHSTDANPTT